MNLQDAPRVPMEQSDAGVIALVGDFDLFRSDELERTIAERAAFSDDKVCLDLTRCTYVDSTILTVFVRAFKTYGDRLCMIVPKNGNVARILAITELNRYLPIVDDCYEPRV